VAENVVVPLLRDGSQRESVQVVGFIAIDAGGKAMDPNRVRRAGALILLALICLALPATAAFAQVTELTPAYSPAPGVIAIGRANSRAVPAQQYASPRPTSYAPPSAPTPSTVRIPEGTEVRVRLEDQLSSATSAPGDLFTVSTTEEIQLADGTVIPPGYRGRREVTFTDKPGMLGKAGQLNMRLDFVRIGGVRVRLVASKGMKGKGSATSAWVLGALVAFPFLAIHGHNVVVPIGTPITAFVDNDTDVPFPVPRPPEQD
jgi:hypothetical protein